MNHPVIELDGGKYSVSRRERGGLVFWRDRLSYDMEHEDQPQHNNLVAAMYDRIVELEEQLSGRISTAILVGGPFTAEQRDVIKRAVDYTRHDGSRALSKELENLLPVCDHCGRR